MSEHGEPGDESAVDRAIRNWVRDGGELSGDDLFLIRQRFVRLVGRRAPQLDQAAGEDIVDRALARVLIRVQRGSLRVATAPAYVTSAVNTSMLDWLRLQASQQRLLSRLAREPSGGPAPPADDVVVRMLDSRATVALVRRALRQCLVDRDMLTARIITDWLDLASASGVAPSLRRVAEKSNVSHTSVATALRAFGDRLHSTLGAG